MKSRYYVLDGKTPRPVDSVEEWGRAFKGIRHVADDTVGDVRVSTVFLGIDHSFRSGPPLLFETLVFGGPHDQFMMRYSTWAEAERGHVMILKALSADNGDEGPDELDTFLRGKTSA